MWRRSIKPFAWLLLFAFIALVAGSWEFYTQRRQTDPANGEVDWYADEPDSYSSLIQSVFPHSNHADFTRGVQAGQQAADLEAAKRHFERAIANHAKDNEELLYAYVIILLNMDVPMDQLQTAVTHWRRNYPQSARPLLIPFQRFDIRFDEDLSKLAQDALADVAGVDIAGVTVDSQTQIVSVPVQGARIRMADLLAALNAAGFLTGPIQLMH